MSLSAGLHQLLDTPNWKLGLAVLTIVPLIMLTFYLVFSRVRNLFRKSQGFIDRLNRVINESILGAAQIRVLEAQAPSMARFDDASNQARNNSLRILRLFAALIPVVSFMAGMGSLILLLLGGHFVILGSLTLGQFAAFNAYLMMLIFPIMMLGFMSNLMARSSASYTRIAPLLQPPAARPDDLLSPELQGEIAVRELAYQPGERPILQPLSFTIAAGSRTAIIGPTAAGKSTLLSLLTALMPASLFIMGGAGIFVLVLNLRLGLVALAPALLIFFWTRLLSPWVKRLNALNLQKTGALSAEIQESLSHFKEIVVFDRRDYFRQRFASSNQDNYQAALNAGGRGALDFFFDLCQSFL